MRKAINPHDHWLREHSWRLPNLRPLTYRPKSKINWTRVPTNHYRTDGTYPEIWRNRDGAESLGAGLARREGSRGRGPLRLWRHEHLGSVVTLVLPPVGHAILRLVLAVHSAGLVRGHRLISSMSIRKLGLIGRRSQERCVH